MSAPDDDEWRARGTSFGSAAEAYDRGRPGYPGEAIAWCLPRHARRVLDLGAGTGKLTQGLLALGLDVIAVEPLDEMRAFIPSPAVALRGRAEDIPLDDACVDAVLVGQAFHWFEYDAALREIARVLRPGGTVGLLWNFYDDRDPQTRAFCDAWQAEARQSLMPPTPDPPYRDVDGLRDPENELFPHTRQVDTDALVADVASTSKVIRLPDDERAAVLHRVRELASPGPFTLHLICNAWRGERRG